MCTNTLFCFSKKSKNVYSSRSSSLTSRSTQADSTPLCWLHLPSKAQEPIWGKNASSVIIRRSSWHIAHDFFIPLSRNSYANGSSTPIPSVSLSRNRSPHFSPLASLWALRGTDTLQTVTPAPSSFYKYTQRRHLVGALSFPTMELNIDWRSIDVRRPHARPTCLCIIWHTHMRALGLGEEECK